MNKFDFNFRLDHIQHALSSNTDSSQWYFLLLDVLPKYDITSINRVAGFLSQCAHESRYFTALEENLNYSEGALNSVFSKYFRGAGRDASEYARQPEKIANVVYANRMGNGATHTGDGWHYRGRGIIQLTGRNNYRSFAAYIGKTLSDTVEYCTTKRGALEAACWYWNSRSINDAADKMNVHRMTMLINGGTNGLSDRKEKYDTMKRILHTNGQWEFDTVRQGDRGDSVVGVQVGLDITCDGIFGPGTHAALVKWQRENNLVHDGVFGQKSMSIMYPAYR